MTVNELIERLRGLPQDRIVVLPVPEYWEGGTEYDTIEEVTQATVFVAYTCKCSHPHERHNRPNPETGMPSVRCRDCNCQRYDCTGVSIAAVVVK
jgi:hypothetical protein